MDLARQLNEIFMGKARIELQLIASKHINKPNFNAQKVRVNIRQLVIESITEYRRKNSNPQERSMTEAGIMIWEQGANARLQTICTLRNETIKSLMEKPLELKPIENKPLPETLQSPVDEMLSKAERNDNDNSNAGGITEASPA